MKRHYLGFLISMLISMTGFAQSGTIQNASIPKDAPIDVKLTDFKGNILNNEIVVFKSKLNGKEYQGLTDSLGKFSFRLPVGDNYEIYILGFKDSVLNENVLNIPPTKGNAYYKDPFKVNIQHLPAKSFVLEDCNFETGKATLQPESYTVLDELVAYLVRKDDEKIELGGHTDNVGTNESNIKLSLKRAESVKKYLLTTNIPIDKITLKGAGSQQPVSDNTTEKGKQQNRRIELYIHKN